MSKLKDYDLYFIHIPKNAGTSFEKQFCGSHKGHRRITEFPKQIWNKTIAIVRNPYTRLISIYNYTKLDKSYWHSKDGTTLYPIHPMYNYSQTHTFDQFIKDICINRKFEDNVHIRPQNEWIMTTNKKLVSKIVKMENINEDLSRIFNKKINMIKINISNVKSYDNYYTEELKKMVYSKYKLDFQLFNYSI